MTVEGCDDPETPTTLLICEREPKNSGTFDQLPFALTPGSPLPDKTLRAAIDAAARDVGSALPDLPQTALLDILLRRPPAPAPARPCPAPAPRWTTSPPLTDLDSSCLAVHGPPGTSKTHTAAHAIARLVGEHGWRIGVVAQSHAVVENLLTGIVEAGVDPQSESPRRANKAADASWLRDRDACLPDIPGRADQLRDRRHRMGFREPAAGCAQNPRPAGDRGSGPVQPGQHHRHRRQRATLLLLGDPQQLPQVSQGHCTRAGGPLRAGLWLIDGRHTRRRNAATS